jgi:hypothetical protein
MTMKVSIGPTSISGWLTFAGLEVGFIAQAIAGAHLHVSSELLAILGVVALVATNAGRHLVEAFGGGGEPSLAAPPETAITPDGAAHAAPPEL